MTALTQPVWNQAKLDQGIQNLVESIATLLQGAVNVMKGLSRSLDPGQHPACVRALQDYCQQEAKTLLDNSRPDFTGNPERLLTLGNWGQPLTVYREGRLQSLPPSQINIVGAPNSELAQKIRDGIHQTGDVTAVETGSDSVVTYLSTHHGIPANAINNFPDYRRHYEELRQRDWSAIFHLDNDSESRFYNPDSIYFFNPNDLEMVFARAAGYGWVVRLENARPYDQPDGQTCAEVYVIENDFQKTLTAVLTRELSRVREKMAEPDSSSPHVLEESRRFFQMVQTELRAYSDHWTLYVESRTTSTDKTDRGYPLRHTRSQRQAESLVDALAAVKSGKTHAFPALFVQAFQQHYQQVDQQACSRRALAFVETRLESSGSHRQFKPVWSRDEANGQVEQQMVNLLRVYLRTVKR